MLFGAVCVYLIGLSQAQFEAARFLHGLDTCAGIGLEDQLTFDKKAYYRCDARENRKFTGCADEQSRFVADGESFDYADSEGFRFRLLCSIENSLFRSTVKASLQYCYGQESERVEKGQSYTWYGPGGRLAGERFAGFIKVCTSFTNGSFGAIAEACAGRNGERVEFGQTYTPFPENPDIAFLCRRYGSKASFNRRFDCSARNRFSCSLGQPIVEGPSSPVPCVPTAWHCDGEDDCGNNADEKDCPARRGGNIDEILSLLRSHHSSLAPILSEMRASTEAPKLYHLEASTRASASLVRSTERSKRPHWAELKKESGAVCTVAAAAFTLAMAFIAATTA